MIPAAWPYVVSLAGLAAILFYLQFPVAAGIFLACAAGAGLFFRDPERRIPSGDHLVVAPADGRIVEVEPHDHAGGRRIAIFLSIFNVHVNRSPVAGKILNVTYRAGSFRPAFAAEASSRNERNTLEVESPAGRFHVSQIAGLIARRIRCFKSAGDSVARGERIGYIAFGSRTEVTVPPEASVLVSRGDKVRAGETVIARLPEPAGEAS